MSRTTRRSDELWDIAQNLIPGGVNSPVRAFGAVSGTPIFVESGTGCCLRDVDGNEYIDYVTSWGALILGHARPEVVKAAQEACANGTTFGMQTEIENQLAERIVDAVPSVD